MQKILKLFIILGFVLAMAPICSAEEYRVLVLPDNLQFESTNYYVYPDCSTMFASEVIDYLNHSGKVKTVSMADVRTKFRANLKLSLLAKSTLKEYKYNYNISFVDLKNIAQRFSVNKVLLITSTTDAQNYILRRTVWDFLNIPGATVIDPVYKLSTFAALIDVDSEKVLWQHTYHKTIGSTESRILAVNFAPSSEQLDKLKLYSSVLSPQIARNVEFGILPAPSLVPSVDAKIVEPINEQVPVVAPPIIELTDIRKPMITKPRAKSGGAMVNDL